MELVSKQNNLSSRPVQHICQLKTSQSTSLAEAQAERVNKIIKCTLMQFAKVINVQKKRN